MDKEAAQNAQQNGEGLPEGQGPMEEAQSRTDEGAETPSVDQQIALAQVALDLQRRQGEDAVDDRDPQWLAEAFQHHLGQTDDNSQYSVEQARQDAAAVSATVIGFRAARQDAARYQATGGGIRNWFAETLGRISQGTSADGTGKYSSRIDLELEKATAHARDTITCNDGSINQSAHLHGHIAEQHHTDSFNIDAATKDAGVRAERLESLERNSPDIRVGDANGTVDYQSKYGESSGNSERAFKEGQYGSQERLVPSGQEGQVEGGTDRVRHGDVESEPLTHEEAKQRQRDAQQEERSKEYSWDDVDLLNLGKQVAKQALLAAALAVAVQGVRIGGRRAWNAWRGNENPSLKADWDEFCDAALRSGVQSGVTVALVGAVVVAARKGWMGAALQSADATLISMAVCVAVENARVLYKLSQEEATLAEAAAELLETNFVAVATLAGSYAGGSLGFAIGAVFGGVCAPIGGFVGSLIGGSLSSAAANAVAKVTPRLVDYLIDCATSIGAKARDAASDALYTLADSVRGVARWVGA
jgi:hypothetical protein